MFERSHVCECMCMFVNVCDVRVCMWLINVVLSVVQPRIMLLFSFKAPLKKHTMLYSFRQKLHCCTLNLTPLWPLSQAAIRLHRRCTYSLIHRKHYDRCSDTLIDSVWWNSDFQKRATVMIIIIICHLLLTLMSFLTCILYSVEHKIRFLLNFLSCSIPCNKSAVKLNKSIKKYSK